MKATRSDIAEMSSPVACQPLSDLLTRIMHEI